MDTSPKPIEPSILSLDFDPLNPRFMDTFGQAHQADAAAIERMLDQENIHELIGSIGQQNYFPGEPLLVTPRAGHPGRFVVVEGNRRLAALRLLNGIIPTDKLPPSLVESIDQAQFRPDKVVCLEFSQRKDILRYLGFRHISGPRRWEPLSKARYLADLIDNFYKNLPFEDQLRAVARDIGSRRDYVAQLLATLKLYDLAKERKYFGLQRLSEQDIRFSLITTALSYRPITDFLGLSSREDVEAAGLNEEHLRDLFAWMFAQNEQGETVLVESRRLKLLAAVVSSPSALMELRKTRDLDHSYIYTSGPMEALTKLFDDATNSLSSGSEMVVGDVLPDESHMAQIERILKIADNLQLLIQRGIQQRKRHDAQRQEAHPNA